MSHRSSRASLFNRVAINQSQLSISRKKGQQISNLSEVSQQKSENSADNIGRVVLIMCHRL